jgi:T-complex protein 1 subunit beta
MDTDKIKIFGARVKVDGTGKLAELERAERVSSPTSFLRQS